jgi:hypothetical protein
VARMTASGVRSSCEALAIPLLALECGLEPAEHLVEGLGQFAEFVAGACRRDPRGQVVSGCGAGGRRDLVHRAQRPSGEDPVKDCGEGDDHRTATVIDASVTGGPDPGQPDFSARLSDLSAA